MKFFIVFCFLIAAVLADHEYHKKTVEDFRKARTECFEKFDVSDKVKEQLKKLEYDDAEVVHNYIHCTSTKLGVWCDDEGYHKQYLMTQFGDDKADILDKCITKKDASWTVAKWAWSNWKCMVEGGLIKDEVKNITPQN